MISESESNFIWGTNINIEEATDMFREFITTFRGGEGGQGGQRGQGGPIYLEMLERLARIQVRKDERYFFFFFSFFFSFFFFFFFFFSFSFSFSFSYFPFLLFPQGACLNVDARHLRSAFPQLYDQLVAYPQEIIPQMDAVVTEIYASFADEEGEMLPIQVKLNKKFFLFYFHSLSPFSSHFDPSFVS